MSARMNLEEKKMVLVGLRKMHGQAASQMSGTTDGTRKHNLLQDLQYHLSHVIEISEELLAIEAREVPETGDVG